MAPNFIPMSRMDFVQAVGAFNWTKPKSSVHVHHTWRPNHNQYRGHSTIESMWRYHTETNGWSDIAQHVSIAPDGTIWSGRNWNSNPASAAGYNFGAFMFETIGDFDVGRDVLKGEQLDSVLTVVATIQIAFGLAPWWSIRFHNQMSGKTCPGSAIDRNQFVAAVSAKRNELEAGISNLISPLAISSAAEDAVRALSAAPVEDAAEDAEVTHGAELDGVFATAAAAVQTMDALQAESPSLSPLMEEIRSISSGPAIGDDELFAELARRTYATGSEHAATLEPMYVGRHVAALGRRIFQRVHRELHTLLCGSEDVDRADREKLTAAFGLGTDAVTAALVGIMTASLAIAQPVAVIVAAIIMRRLLAPTYLETCIYWREQLS